MSVKVAEGLPSLRRPDLFAVIREVLAEAIQTVMDRGSLSDWRLLAEAVRESPWGRTARLVDSIS